jgi:hypothetical protein
MLYAIDTSTDEKWAESLLKRIEYATNFGFGLCYDGTPYDLHNFLCDTFIGDVPWSPRRNRRVYMLIFAHPDYERIESEFFAKYKRSAFGTREQYEEAMK